MTRHERMCQLLEGPFQRHGFSAALAAAMAGRSCKKGCVCTAEEIEDHGQCLYASAKSLNRERITPDAHAIRTNKSFVACLEVEDTNQLDHNKIRQYADLAEVLDGEGWQLWLFTINLQIPSRTSVFSYADLCGDVYG